MVVLAAGLGAPAAVITMELLVALGVRRFVQLGTAGALGESLSPGQVVMCERAWRGEGTSVHYSGDSDPWAPLPDRQWLQTINENLIRNQSPVELVSAWTTDAPYRETAADVQKFLGLGISTVDMETSAVYAFASAQDHVAAVSVFVISDQLTTTGWQPWFHRSEVKAALRGVADRLIPFLKTSN